MHVASPRIPTRATWPPFNLSPSDKSPERRPLSLRRWRVPPRRRRHSSNRGRYLRPATSARLPDRRRLSSLPTTRQNRPHTLRAVRHREHFGSTCLRQRRKCGSGTKQAALGHPRRLGRKERQGVMRNWLAQTREQLLGGSACALFGAFESRAGHIVSEELQ